MLSGSESDKMNCAFSLPLISSNKSLLKKLLLDSGGLLSALQPLGCEDDDADDDHPAECGRLLSDWFNSGLTSQLHSLYFSLLIGCLSALTGTVKTDIKLMNPLPTLSVSKTGRVSPPPSKRPRLADTCPYGVSHFDLLLLLDDGTRVPANREAVAGVEGSDGAGSEYFRALLRGGFGEAQGKAEEAIHIKDVSTGMLLPVLHYLHGCRLTKTETTQEAGEGGRRGQCHILNALVLDGLNICQKETEEHSAEDLAFQKTSFGEAMIGACRFLVIELQRELEDLCVSLLLPCSTKTPAPSEDNAEKAAPKMDQEVSESAEENLASRTSELELTGTKMQTENLPEQTEKLNSSLNQTDSKKSSSVGAGQKVNKGLSTASDKKTIKTSKSECKSVDPEELTLRPKNLVKDSAQLVKSAAQGSHSSSESVAGGGALAALLPQVYWFSQRYSYPALGRACLSLLLGCQDCPRPFSSSAIAGDCLRRLAREADCTETLKQDLLSLASAALS